MTANPITLPDWWECMEKDNAGEVLTALERFIYDNEPAGKSDSTFRAQLAAVLLEARS